MDTYKKKFKTSLIFVLFPILLYGILGPLEIYAGNADEFIFILKDFFWIFLGCSVLLWVAASAVLALFSEKICNFLHILIFIFSILSYIQNMFLNVKLMNMNGHVMDWDSMHDTMVRNIVIWIIISIVLLIVPLVFRKYYQKIYLGISGFISAVQIITIITLLITSIPVKYSLMTVSSEGQLEFAPQNNVVVLVFDSCFNTQFEDTMSRHPEIVQTLKDFTYYDNADSHYCFTFPSLAHMLTGVEYDCNMTAEDWKKACWHQERSEYFYGILHSLNYECDLYSYGFIHESIGPIENIADIFSNTIKATPHIEQRLLCVEMLKMTIYKYVPYVLKPRFEVPDYIVHEMAFWDGNTVPYENGELLESLMENGLSVNDSLENKFLVIHLAGLHPLWQTNADGTYSETETSLAETSDGVGVVMREYIEQLKALDGDIYDNATVIITADHGVDRFSPQPIYFIKPPHTVQEEMQITSAPISHDEFQATVLKCIGEDRYAAEFGSSVFDWKDGDQRTREFWYPADRIIDGANTGFFIFTYDTDRYELMQMKDEEAVFVDYP